MKVVIFAAVLASAFAQLAFATSELQFISGTNTLVVAGIGSTVTYSNTNFDGWDISIVFGASNSPGLSGVNGNFGIDASILAACTDQTCSSNPLDIFLSDTGFTQEVNAGGFSTVFSTTQYGGTTDQLSWDTTADTIFGKGTLIGELGTFTGSGVGSVSGGGPAGPSPYSLTIETTFNGSGGSASFSTNGYTTATPEPNPWVLCGIGLALCAAALRRRRLS